MKNNRFSDNGMTLIEVVVAISLTMLITAPIISIYINVAKKVQILAMGNAYNIQSYSFSKELINDVAFSQEIYAYSPDEKLYGCDGAQVDPSLGNQIGTWTFNVDRAFKKTLFRFQRYEWSTTNSTYWNSSIGAMRSTSFYYLERVPDARSQLNGLTGFFRIVKIKCSSSGTVQDFKFLDLGSSLCSSTTNPQLLFFYNSNVGLPQGCLPIEPERLGTSIDSMGGRSMIAFSSDGSLPAVWPLSGTEPVNINLPIGDSLPIIFGTLNSLKNDCMGLSSPSNVEPLCKLPRYFNF